MAVINFEGYTLTEEEVNVLRDTLNKMREEKRKSKAIQESENYLFDISISMIDAIGLDETKRIFRKVTHALREAI